MMAEGKHGNRLTLMIWVTSAAFLALCGLGIADRFPAHAQATGCQNNPTAPTCTPGPPLPGLNLAQTAQYNKGASLFTGAWTPTTGLGVVFTQVGCVNCHAAPLAGGFSSTIQVTRFGKFNSDGTFNPMISEGGPTQQPFSVAGRNPVPATCKLPGEIVPADATIISKRETPPTFGNGLMDAIPDATILANAVDQGLGIHGTANMVTDLNTGTLRPGRFGWKAQQPTLLQFVAGAFQGEIGVTNPIFPIEDLPQGQPIPPSCQVSLTNPDDQRQGGETLNIFDFEEFLAPLPPKPPTQASQAGQQVFTNIGCAKCHLPSMQTASKVLAPFGKLNTNGTVITTEEVTALEKQTANLYSDLLLHDMGAGLNDNVTQVQASGSQWRTTPLWGLSSKTFYLHDGRTSDLTTAILAHGGEATLVIQNFQQLSSTDQSNLLAFLNSL